MTSVTTMAKRTNSASATVMAKSTSENRTR